MKTQLLQLDPFDDSPSTREKLRWIQADRVVLVWPAYGEVLRRRLDLVLLQREARRHGAQLGLVCHDPKVRDNAEELGLPVFDDPDRIDRQPWPAPASKSGTLPAPPSEARRPLPPRPAPSSPPSRKGEPFRRAALVSAVALSLLSLAAVVGPVAVVELDPVEIPVEASVAIVLAPAGPASVAAVAISSRSLRTEVEGSLRSPTSGSVSAPTSFAEGTVLFSAIGESEVVIPEGSGVRAGLVGGPRFVTVERALIPAGGGTPVRVPIRSASPGPQGNVPAGSIVAVEGTLGLQVTVSNPSPTEGGAQAQVPGVSVSDAEQVRAALERQLLQEANARWTDLLEQGEALLPGSIRIATVTRAETEPDVGQPSESVEVRLTLVVETPAYQMADLEQVVAEAVGGAVPAGRQVFRESIRYELTPRRDPSGWGYLLRVYALTYDPGSGASVGSLIAGRRIEAAAPLLRGQVDLDRQPVIRIWPTWWPWLPILPFRIQTSWASG